MVKNGKKTMLNGSLTNVDGEPTLADIEDLLFDELFEGYTPGQTLDSEEEQ
jgi:hypothetical protein